MKKTVSLLLVLLFTLLLMGSALADAIVYPGTIWSVDYDVWVTTPDGGLNMRDGPGTSYPLIQTIPDYVQLHIDTESSLGWGYTFYNDHWGCIIHWACRWDG